MYDQRQEPNEFVADNVDGGVRFEVTIPRSPSPTQAAARDA